MSEQPFFFTWTKQRDVTGVNVTGAEGVYFQTADGSRWLDMGSLSYQANLGHGNKRVIAAIKKQADELCLAMPNAIFPAKVDLARRLLELAPNGFSKVFFTNGGSEAVENALKIARLVTGRYKMISRYRSYHGATMGAVTLSGDWRRPPLEPGLPGIIHAMDCYCDACPFGKEVSSCQRECAHHIGEILRLEGPGSVAAVILESVPGANGVLVPPAEYWPIVRSHCDEHGALLIADEVLTGFGRTGRCFGFEHFDVVPDLITVAKGLTGGYAPLGAVLVHSRVAEYFDDNVLVAGLTNYGHPLGCAAGLAALQEYEERDLFARAAHLGTIVKGELNELGKRFSASIRSVRGLGFLVALEFHERETRLGQLAAEIRKRNLFLHFDPARRTAIFAPPLIIEEAQLREGLGRFAEAMLAALGGV